MYAPGALWQGGRAPGDGGTVRANITVRAVPWRPVSVYNGRTGANNSARTSIEAYAGISGAVLVRGRWDGGEGRPREGRSSRRCHGGVAESVTHHPPHHHPPLTPEPPLDPPPSGSRHHHHRRRPRPPRFSRPSKFRRLGSLLDVPNGVFSDVSAGPPAPLDQPKASGPPLPLPLTRARPMSASAAPRSTRRRRLPLLPAAQRRHGALRSQLLPTPCLKRRVAPLRRLPPPEPRPRLFKATGPAVHALSMRHCHCLRVTPWPPSIANNTRAASANKIRSTGSAHRDDHVTTVTTVTTVSRHRGDYSAPHPIWEGATRCLVARHRLGPHPLFKTASWPFTPTRRPSSRRPA